MQTVIHMEQSEGVISAGEQVYSVTSSAIETMSTGSLCSPTPNILNNPLSLTEVWEIYIRNVKSQDQSADNVERQSVLLDLLLHMCTLQIRQGTSPAFSDMKSVCNQLCKEFMTDILHITNKSEDDDSTHLQRYLLEGRGFQLLQVIHRKGVQNVSGGRDLANLLVSLLPWCLKFPSQLETIPDLDINQVEDCFSQTSISQCFQRVYRSSQSRANKQRFQAIPCTRYVHKVPRELSSVSIRSKNTSNKRFSKRKSTEVTVKDYKNVSDNDSSDGQKRKTKGRVRRKSRYYHIHSAAERLEQQKVESDSDADDLYDLLKTVQKEEIKVCGLELCVLVLNLLLDLSSIDLLETSPGKLISLRIIPQLLQCLKYINDEKEAGIDNEFNRKARQILTRLTLRVVFSCCAIISAQSKGTNILISHKVVETVLSIGKKYSVNISTDRIEYQLHSKDLDIVCDSTLGLLHCFVVIFDNLPFNPTCIKNAVGLLEMFDDHRGFQLLHQCILYHDWLKYSSSEDINVLTGTILQPGCLEDEPLKVFGNFLCTMKIVRVNYLHSLKCLKRKHQKCTYTQYFDHHHDILGVPVKKHQSSGLSEDRQNPKTGHTQSNLPGQITCIVSSNTQFLLDLLNSVLSKSMRLDLVKTIYSAGVCCCMDLHDIVSGFVSCVGKFSPAVRTFALDALNKVILEHFSGNLVSRSRDVPTVHCSTCDSGSTNCRVQNTDKVHTSYTRLENKKLSCLEGKGLDSGFDSSHASKEKDSAFQKLSKWRPVGQLKNLLYSSDESLAMSAAKHLMVLAIKGNPYLKAELFFSVYINALELETTGKSEQKEVSSHSLAKTVQVHCLSALPYVLQANCVTRAFLSRNGVKKLCHLLEDDILRIPVLRIFEALVVQDEQKLLTTDNAQAECPCPYRGGVVIETFVNELSKRSFDSDTDSCSYNSDGKPRRIRHDSVVLSKFSLPVLVDLWQTCARLCLCNHSFVSLFQDNQNMYLYKTEALLLETLDILTSPSLIGYLQSHASTETEDSGMETDHMLPTDIDQADSESFNMRVSLLESLMVVVGACYEHMEKQNYSSFKTWNQMQDQFKQPLNLKSTKVKAILDTVLNAAMPQLISVLGYSYHKNIALVYMRDDDIYDEDEVRQLLQSASEEDLEVTNEIGYDGDSEGTLLDEKDKDKHVLERLTKSGVTYKMYFPATFRLLFEILVQLHKQDAENSVIHAVLHKLVQTVRADPNIVHAMCKQDILTLILSESGFWPYMLTNDSEVSVRDNLLVMVQYLGQHKLKSCDLQKILQLFQHSNIPMEHLLPVVHSIVENSEPMAHYSLTFPSRTNNIFGDTARDALTPTLDCISSSVSPILKAASSFLKFPMGKTDGIGYEGAPRYQQQEIWGISPIQLKLGDGLAWPPFQNGFTVALWLRLDADNKQNFNMDMPMFDLDSDGIYPYTGGSSASDPISKCLHIASIGTTEKLMEIWADTATNSLIFRLTSEVSDMGLVVREIELTGVMSPARWQHLVVCYVESLDGSTLTGKANVIIDGWQNHAFVLDHPFSAIKARHRSSSALHPALCLGHMVPDPSLSQIGTASLGNLYLFKGAGMKKEHSFHLYTLGPNWDSLLKCDCTEDRAMYTPHLHKNSILHSKISHDSLVGLTEVDLKDLRSSLLLSYNPRNHQDMMIYPGPSRSNQGQVPGNLAYVPDSLLTQQPRIETPILLSNLSIHINYSLEKALEESGGIAAILFLVAKVYERCPESMPTDEAEKIQAEAVKVLLSVVHHSSQLQAEYKDSGGHALLCKVLTSCRRVVGKHILKVLMDATTTESLFKVVPGTTNLMVRHRSDAVIRDSTIIDQIILEWQVWEGSSHSLLELLFSGLANLIREDHPHQQYNIKQYQVINIVSKIFKVYQERIQEGFPALPINVSQSVVSIIQNMIGSPPDPHLIIEICDFLLMVHPAANTYINHSRSSFYFTLPWGLPPSPLTKWRQDLELTGAITSTPRKLSTTPTDVSSKKSERNVTQDLTAKLESEISYPFVDLTKESTLEQNSNNNAQSLVFQDKMNQQEASLDYKTEIEYTEESHVLASYSSNIISQHKIPGNFASLYKKSDSLDGNDSLHLEGVEALEAIERSMSDQTISDVTEEGNDGTDVSMTKEHLSLNFDEDNMEMLRQEQGLTALCVGLLRMLSSVIIMMPDTQVERAFQRSIINPQTFIVLMQSSSSEIREAVIKVIDAYLSRSNPAHTEVFLKMEGFQLMSSQLYQYPTHQEQMEAAVSIVIQRPFMVDEGLHEDEIIEDLSQIQQAAIPVILALLGNSTGDLALCHNSLQFFNKLFETSDIVAVVMMEQGLVEVLCNMLQKLFDNGNRCTDVEGMDENEILLGDLLDFFKVIAVKEFSVSGPQHYQHFEDIVVLLQEMERKEKLLQGENSKCCQTLRQCQYHLLVSVIEVVEKMSEEYSHQSPFNLLSKISTKAPQYAEGNSLLHVSSSPSLPPHRNFSIPAQHFSLSGAFSRFTMPTRKHSGSFFIQSDHPYQDSGPSGGSSGDSDNSQDSWHNSVQTVNLPIGKPGYLRTKSSELSQGKLLRNNSLLQTVLSIGKRKKLSTVPISQKELIERLKKMVLLAVDTCMFSERKPGKQRKEVFLFEMAPRADSMDGDFLKRLFMFCYRAFETTLPQEKNTYKRTKNSIIWGAKDTLRIQLGRLLALMLSDRQERETRVYALSFIMGDERGVDVLKMIISMPEVANDLAYHVRNLMKDGRQLLAKQQIDDGAKLMNHISAAGYTVISAYREPSSEQREMLEERKRLIHSRLESEKHVWLKRKENALNRIFHRHDSLSARLCDTAMEVTQSVTQLQTKERTKFITHIKHKKTQSIQVKKQWQEIVQNLTHERAVWHDEESYPKSWQLNPTEGPCRVRKRLQRGHLGILPRFLMKEHQSKLASETVDPPLIYLFEDDHQMSDSAALIYQLHKNNKIRYTCSCRAVSPNSESKGELLIGEESVFFVADEAITDANYTQVLLGNKDQLSMTWPFEDVLEIHKRWYELMDTAIEIFLTNGKTCLLAFRTTKERDELFRHLNQLELPNKIFTGNLMDVIFSWENGHITNFEYLTHLNKLAGRSFNDLMQYPIMPFILRDYTSDKLDLEQRLIYRDLTKPVSVQDPKNEQKFMTNYAVLKQEYDKMDKGGITSLRVAPYHYGSHYSNSGCVLHFLVRLPPFTKMFLNFQDQNFDIPDRTFHNLHTSWRLSSAESNTDVKELIPEFFFCHEIFRNTEGFDFGQRQNGERVNDVVLPPWCDGSPRLFTLIHRQALESDYVTETLGAWIDLVFGAKQQGDAAVRAINVFHPATYFGLDVSTVKNPVDRKAIQTMVRTYGQTPKKLFTVQHTFKRSQDSNKPELHRQASRPPQIKGVAGLKWGSYLGSPDKPAPEVSWEAKHPSQVASLVALPNSYVFGIGTNSCLLLQHSQDKEKALVTDTQLDVVWGAILTWNQPDGILKIVNGKNKPPVNLLHYSQSDKIVCCVSVPDCRYLIIGGSSGVITVYNSKHNPAKESQLQVFDHKRCLYGHMGSVQALVVCKPYSILVSASQDGTCIIWDLNRLSYVRSIKGHKSGVQVLAVSDTLGDIASVCHHGLGSYLYLHTVNAEYVAMATCEDTINCLTYSTAPEGSSINVIAGGLSSGVIRMWSSWDLAPVRDLKHSSLSATPIISLTFTKNSQRLYMSSADGRVTLWDYSREAETRTPKFKPFLYPT